MKTKLVEAKMLAIDEISMLNCNIFNNLDILLKNIRQNDNPFGGLQIILLGDFLQLPPVPQAKGIKEPFCFESETWQEANIQYIELNNIFRQKEEKLITLLNNVRFGRLTGDDIEILKRCKNRVNNDELSTIIIGTHNKIIHALNNNELAKLNSNRKRYIAEYIGDKTQFDSSIIQEELELKIGAKVMMIKNNYSMFGIMNGSIGNVVAFGENGFPIVKFSNGKEIEISKATWEKEIFDGVEIVTIATVTQIPLI
jgi:ATP-dependent DNA helicase PIF1